MVVQNLFTDQKQLTQFIHVMFIYSTHLEKLKKFIHIVTQTDRKLISDPRTNLITII